jgi:CheY-like chemotaxis protein
MMPPDSAPANCSPTRVVPPAPDRRAGEAAAEAPLRILLAEDDRFLRKAVETTLRRHGHTVFGAADGEEALRMTESERPDVVLLDMILPKLQGFEVLRALKGNPRTTAIPVIVLSSLSQAEDRQEALQAGAAAYFVKATLSLQAIAGVVERVIRGGAST